MNGLAGARCVGMHWLFDSVDLTDHAEAAKLCAECPARDACRERLWSVTTTALYGGPVGTWAGQLVGTQRKPEEHGTERGWQQHRHRKEPACDPCRKAHAEAWRTGRKAQVNPTNRTLERVEFKASEGRIPGTESDPLATVSTRAKGA